MLIIIVLTHCDLGVLELQELGSVSEASFQVHPFWAVNTPRVEGAPYWKAFREMTQKPSQVAFGPGLFSILM